MIRTKGVGLTLMEIALIMLKLIYILTILKFWSSSRESVRTLRLVRLCVSI